MMLRPRTFNKTAKVAVKTISVKNDVPALAEFGFLKNFKYYKE